MPAEPCADAFRNPFARYFAATRPAFFGASILACLIGFAVARRDGIGFDAATAWVALFSAVLAHAGVNVLNDFYDIDTDAQNTGRIYPYTGGSRFIQNGVLSAQQTRNFGFGLFFAVLLAGLWLMLHSGFGLLYIGLAGLLIGWAYSAPPLRLSSRGLGELCVAAGFLLVSVGADFVQRKGFSADPLIAAVSYALLVANLLYISQFPDRVADAAAGKLHWVARLSPARARWGFVPIALSAYGWLVMAVLQGWLPAAALSGLLALPLSAMAARQLFIHADQPQRLGGAIRLTIAAMLLHGAALSLALLV